MKSLIKAIQSLYIVTFQGPPREQDIAGKTPLHYAATSGRSFIVHSLIQNDADVVSILLEGLSILDDLLPLRFQEAKTRIEATVKDWLSPVELSKENISSVLRILPKLIPCAERARLFGLWFDQSSPLPVELKLVIQEALGDMEIIGQLHSQFRNTLLHDCIKHPDKYKALQAELLAKDWCNDCASLQFPKAS